MKNSLVILALATTLLAGNAFAQGSTTTTKRTVTTSTTTIPHSSTMSPEDAQTAAKVATKAAMKGKTCPTCDAPVAKKKAKGAKKSPVAAM